MKKSILIIHLILIIQVISETLGPGKLSQLPEHEATTVAGFQVSSVLIYYCY